MKHQSIVVLGVGIAISLSLAGCGSSPEKKVQDTPKAVTTQEQAVAKKDFDGSKQEEIGEGTVTLYTAAGSTENGNVPKMTLAKDIATQLDIDTRGLNSAVVTYIYVDGIENMKANLGDSQQTFTIQGDAVKEGSHTVELVQFKDDNTSSEVVFYRKLTYQVVN